MAVTQESLRTIDRASNILTNGLYPSIENRITEINNTAHDEKIAFLFSHCLRSAASTTFNYAENTNGKPFTHVSNGDIGFGVGPMWTRDATSQAEPYLDLINEDEELRKRVLGIINMQTEYVLRDSYANAYYLNEDKFSSHILDVTHMKPGIHERKWAPDSLAFVVRLAYNYWQKTGDASFADTQWDNASRSIYHTFLKQQRLENEGDYTFQRLTFRKTEIVPRFGLGAQTKKIGLIHATHRPSDDACELPFHIPSNLFVAQSLRQLSEMYLIIPERRDEIFAKRCQKLSNTIINAVFEHGIIDHPKFGRIFAFEIDGRGHSVIHDDASPPQLVSLPMYSDIDPDSEVYQNTRNLALSFNNPNYFKGNAAEGLGSSHTGRDRICTISPMIRAITSDNDEEIRHCLEILKNIHNKQFQYGESVLVNGTNVGSRDSRKWFPWPDSTFAYLILKLQSERPYLL